MACGFGGTGDQNEPKCSISLIIRQKAYYRGVISLQCLELGQHGTATRPGLACHLVLCSLLSKNDLCILI